MKTIKLLVLVALLVTAPVATFSQDNDKGQAYLVHEDQVKPSKVEQYEQLAKEYKEACVKHGVEDNFNVAENSNGSYLSITPIEKMADLDANNNEMREKMGEEKFSSMMKKFNECYDKHGSYIVWLNNDLTYMPDGISVMQEDKNYRKWHFIHVTPENKAAMAEKMKDVKKMFADKNSKMHYRVYQNGFGQMGDYYLVVVSAKNELDYAQMSEANRTLLGPESKAVFGEIMKLADSYEETTGWMRPDLSYSSTATAKK